MHFYAFLSWPFENKVPRVVMKMTEGQQKGPALLH